MFVLMVAQIANIKSVTFNGGFRSLFSIPFSFNAKRKNIPS